MRWLLFPCVVLIAGCSTVSLDGLYTGAQQHLNHGELGPALSQARQGLTLARDPELTWRFRWLQSEVLLQRRDGEGAWALLTGDLPMPLRSAEIGVRVEINRGCAQAWLKDFSRARTHLNLARQLCNSPGSSNKALLGEVYQREGMVDMLEDRYPDAERSLHEALTRARANHDPYLEANALASLGAIQIHSYKWAQAIEWTTPAVELARKLSIKTLLEKNLGILALSNLKMGDSDRALTQLKEAESIADQIGIQEDRLRALQLIGIVYNDREDYTTATEYYSKALEIARAIGQKQYIARALQNLSVAMFDSKNYDSAEKYNREAREQYRANNDKAGELYSRYVHAYLARERKDYRAAEEEFAAIVRKTQGDLSLLSLAQLSLARVHIAQSRTGLAEQDFQNVIKTIERARRDLVRDDFKMLFRSQSNHYYNDYIQLLMSQRKWQQAFNVSELSRAQVLSDRLGADRISLASVSRPKEIARSLDAIVLSYWLGPQASYLWVVTGGKFVAFTLPKAEDINSLVEEFRRAIASPGNIRESANPAGLALYKTLVAPAQEYIAPDARVIVVPDGVLHQLNFETLLVPGTPRPHYWISDAVVSTATSVALLRAPSRATGRQNLLVIGNPDRAAPEYAPLLNAAAEVRSVAERFPPARRTVFEGPDAQPSSYRGAHPEQFSWIHFAAHGVANKESPLDSAIVLSRGGDSFKLFARDVAALPLNADLVTISACYGSGLRNYSGEGLVGLAWAFLLAGAHNVVAALWEVNDYYTPRLMDNMYERLQAGEDPAHALRGAKMSLLNSQYICRNPRYWAAFQLYTGY